MSQAPASASLYATIWRWHFYAGLFAAPFLLILSVTGAIYLFNDEINDRLHADLRFATHTGPVLPPGRLIDAALGAYPGARVTRVDLPTATGRSAMLHLVTADGAPRRVFVDPAGGQVLGSFVYERTLVGLADRMHGSLLLGDVGDAIVEIAACWTAVLVLTGLYLWWPRGGGGNWLPRLRARGRSFWRDLHKLTGLYAAVLILFLVMSGLPWAGIWGGQFLTPVSNALGVGYPVGNRTKAQMADTTMGDAIGEVPWTLTQAPMPRSLTATGGGMHAHHHPVADAPPPGARGVTISVDEAARILAAHGMSTAYRLTLPEGPTGAYTAYTYPDRPQGQRTLHLDRYSGEVLADIRFADYGPVAKAVEWGVSLHMGNYFGRANQIVMLLACVAIIALVLTGLVMWWCRRPQGRLGVPRVAVPLRARHAVAAMLALALLFPLAAASLLLALAMDAGLRAARRRLGSVTPAA